MKKISNHKVYLPDGTYRGKWNKNYIEVVAQNCGATIETIVWNQGNDPVTVRIKKNQVIDVEFV